MTATAGYIFLHGFSGIDFKMGQKVTGTSEAANGKLTLSYEAVKDGKAGEMTADIVLVATGRRPVTGSTSPLAHAVPSKQSPALYVLSLIHI